MPRFILLRLVTVYNIDVVESSGKSAEAEATTTYNT